MVKNLPCNARDADSIPHAMGQFSLRVTNAEPVCSAATRRDCVPRQRTPRDATKIPSTEMKT